MTRQQRQLFDIYAAAAIALLFLVSTVNAIWIVAFAMALAASALVVVPTERSRIIAVTLTGAATGLVVAALVRLLA